MKYDGNRRQLKSAYAIEQDNGDGDGDGDDAVIPTHALGDVEACHILCEYATRLATQIHAKVTASTELQHEIKMAGVVEGMMSSAYEGRVRQGAQAIELVVDRQDAIGFRKDVTLWNRLYSIELGSMLGARNAHSHR